MLVVLLVLSVVLPAFPAKEFVLGVAVGAVVMVAALSVARFDDPRMRGHLAETFSLESLRKVSGWLVLDNLPFGRVDVDHVVVTPSGVVAVETKYHGALDPTSRAAHERAHRDRVAASAAARKVRSFLASKGVKDESVTPLLMVWGPGRPVIAEGARVVEDVVVVDSMHPELWSRRFAAPLVPLDRRREVFDVLSAYAKARVEHEAARTVRLRTRILIEARAGVAEERAERAVRSELASTSRRRHAHPRRQRSGEATRSS